MKKSQLPLLIVLILIVFSSFLSFEIRVASDFPLISTTSLQERFILPQTWTVGGAVGLGEYAIATLWMWPLNVLFGLGSKIGFSFAILERFIGIIPFILLGVYSINKLLENYKIKGWGRFVGNLIYLVNTYILLVIDGGQLAIALAYSVFPLAYLSIIKAIDGKLKEKLLSALFLSILGFFDIRFLYVLLMLLLLHFIYETVFLKKDRILAWVFGWITSGVLIALVFLGLNFYWILPSILVKAPTLPETYTRVTQTSFLSFATWKHALLLLQPHWYKNVFGKVTPILYEFILIPIFVILAPFLVWILKSEESKLREMKEVSFWCLVALVGVFLVKGSNTPLPNVYPWLFSNIPGFSLFRDPTKFFFLVALSYSVLIGFTIDLLMKRYDWTPTLTSGSVKSFWLGEKLKIGNWKLSPIPLLLTIYFLLLIYPVYTGKMTGMLSEPYNKEQFYDSAELIKKDSDFGRVFFIPSRPPLGYSSPKHPSVEASRLVNLRPFSIGVVGRYEQFNFLREAPFMGELFDIAAIEYIAYPYPDTRREELKQDNIDYYYNFSNQIEGLDWVGEKISQPPVQVFKTKKSQDHLFIAPNTFLVVGSDDIYKDLVEVEDFSLSNNALVFSEESPDLGRIAKQSDAVILNNKSATDFAATFLSNDKLIFPADYLDFDPNSTKSPSSGRWLASRSLDEGWWKRETSDFIWWRDFLQQKYGIDNQDFDYGGGWAIAEGNRKLQISNSKFQKDNILLARVMMSSRGGRVEFYQEDKLVGEINTKYDNPRKEEIKLTGYGEIPDQYFEFDKADFLWFEIGKLTTDLQSLTIKTEGDINVVNSLAFVSEEEWQQINELIHEFNIVDWDDLFDTEKQLLFSEDTDAKISYKRQSPTHYRVFIENIDEPVTLAFSETYDSLWEISGQNLLAGSQASYPLYSLINGFYIERDGVYDINFSAQKYIYPGLAISIFTASALGIYLLVSKKRTKI